MSEKSEKSEKAENDASEGTACLLSSNYAKRCRTLAFRSRGPQPLWETRETTLFFKPSLPVREFFLDLNFGQEEILDPRLKPMR